MTRHIWQIAAGEPGRYYDKLFLDHDVMFMGPGQFGKFNSSDYSDLVKNNDIRPVDYECIDYLVNKVKPRDIILLLGQYIKAIGLVTSPYDYYDQFNDIYVWDLQHGRRVCWQPQFQNTLESMQAVKGLFNAKRYRPLSMVHEIQILSAIQSLIPQCKIKPNHKLKPLPNTVLHHLDWTEIKQHLSNKGLRYDNAEKIVNVLYKCLECLIGITIIISIHHVLPNTK